MIAGEVDRFVPSGSVVGKRFARRVAGPPRFELCS